MLRKLSVFTLLSVAICSVVNAQNQNSEPKGPTEKKIQRSIPDMIIDGSYLGVQTQEISKENMTQFNLREVRGVGVEKVLENSPASQAGLQNGDVILKFNGEDVSSVRKLTRLIGEVAPDHQARLTILRGGNEREIMVTLGKRPVPKFENGGMLERLYGLPGIPEYPNRPMPQVKPLPPLGNDQDIIFFGGASNRQIGAGVTPLTKQLGDYFGVSNGKGLLVNNVRENSPAAKAGLKAGDIIVEVDGKQVKETFDLIRAVNEKKEGDVTLTIVREKNRQNVRVAPEVSKDGIMPFKEFEKFDGNNSN